MSLMSLLTSPSCPYENWWFIFQDTLQSFFHRVRHSPSLTSEQHLLSSINTNHHRKMGETDIPTILCGGKKGCVQTCIWVCDWRWPVQPISHPSCGVTVRNFSPCSSPPRSSPPPPLLSLFLHNLKTAENPINHHRQWESDRLYLTGN